MVRTLILYESKNGFTEKTAKKLALALGPAKYFRASEFKGDNHIYDVIILCVPVYNTGADNKMIQYTYENSHWIKQKKVILLFNYLKENKEEKYLKTLKNILGQSVVYESSVSSGITKKDFGELALSIKKIKDTGNKIMEDNMLKLYIDDFIKKHNTCALATGHDERVRATPLEYVFMGKCLYIISEGGEKFINILINKNVSVCIYDTFKKMHDLAGMQIMGTAEIIDTGSNEYISVITQKGLNYSNINALPVNLNMIKINIKKIEFLWSQFDKLGYDTKQIFYSEKF